MRKLVKLLIAFSTLAIFAGGTAFAESVNSLEPDGFVTDKVGFISPETKSVVAEQQAKFDRTAYKPQITILTVNSTDGKSIDDFTNQLLSKPEWQFGRGGQGILVVFAKNGGQNNVRIATGRETKKIITDQIAMRYLNDNRETLKSGDLTQVDLGLRNLYGELARMQPTSDAKMKSTNITISEDDDLATVEGVWKVIGRIAVLIFIPIVIFIPISIFAFIYDRLHGYSSSKKSSSSYSSSGSSSDASLYTAAGYVAGSSNYSSSSYSSSSSYDSGATSISDGGGGASF